MSRDWDVTRKSIGSLSIWLGTAALFVPRALPRLLGVDAEATRTDTALPLLVRLIAARNIAMGAALPAGGRPALHGALRRGSALAWTAMRAAPVTVLVGVVLGGAVSALLTLPASIAALGLSRVVGPLDDPGVGAFAVAAVSDVVASAVTLPFLALVVVLVAGRLTPRAAGQ